jgi:hypothetical protein
MTAPTIKPAIQELGWVAVPKPYIDRPEAMAEIVMVE